MSRTRKLAHRALFMLSRSFYMTCCCGCCSALRPRYKRLVDNIFPAAPQDGLVKANMEKLTFYSLSSPEKLDRIGEYLFQKASRDIYRRRHGFVIIAMEAMDQLLLACHAQTLNLFVESFLKMVQKLLESTDPQLQTLATQSFVRFANIEEDTPSYHRRYDFFVSKFSAMCHSAHAERDTIRLAGIQGLQGVIRKTVSDDLVENIWEAQHMDKIVPSLLYNMQSAEKYETVSCLGAEERLEAEARPPRLAEACLRELVGRASFGHIRSVLRPVLTHFDRHELWIPSDFAVHVFKIIMFSIQAAYSYSVVEALMQHLEAAPACGGGARVRAARATVLSNIVALAAADTVGPSVLEIINNLLSNLRASVTRDTDERGSERAYQAALMEALGEFAEHLPDYQKIDIMMFIVNKIPAPPAPAAAPASAAPATHDHMLQTILLESLLKVGGTYQTRELSKAFPGAFLEALLRLARGEQRAARLLLQRILHTLLDRHRNKLLLAHPTVEPAALRLSLDKCSRQDLIFIGKHGYAIFSSLYDVLQLESNSVENVEAIYTTLALLVAELGCGETAPDLMQLVLAIQQSGAAGAALAPAAQCRLQAVALSLAALLAAVADLPRLQHYIAKIASARREEAPHLLPPLRAEYPALASGALPSALPHLLVDQLAVLEALQADGVEAARLHAAAPYAPSHPHPHRHSWLESGAGQGRDSLADIAHGALTEMDSANSSPGVTRCEGGEFWHWSHEDVRRRAAAGARDRACGQHARAAPEHELAVESISLEALRRAAAGPSEAERRDAERRRATLNNTFRTAPFDHLLTITHPQVEIKEKLSEIFSSISSCPLVPTGATGAASPPHGRSFQQDVPPYCKYFPELFLY